MKFMVLQVVAACLISLSGCADAPQANAGAVSVAKDERCLVTGSNLPKRECRGDVTVLPPAAADSVMPVLPGPGVRP